VDIKFDGRRQPDNDKMMKMKLSIYSYITWRILYYQVLSSSHDPNNFLASIAVINKPEGLFRFVLIINDSHY
jgi:hypothetical protein